MSKSASRTSKPGAGSGSTGARVLLWVVALTGLLLVLGSAWVAEDAFISFRVSDNAAHGYGLRWNTDERVQAFTNPLWTLLFIPIRAVEENIFLSAIIVSVLCSVGAVTLAAKAGRKSDLLLAVSLLLPLALSKSFVEYATSGLENPLSFLLFGLFLWTLFARKHRVPPWFRLSLIASLAAVNRLDTFLIYVPALAYLLVVKRRSVAWKALLAGTLPLVAWELFSIVYYGFPFPNTAYAKLGTGVPRLDYIVQGLYYLADFARRDPGGFLVVAGVTGFGLRTLLRRGGDGDERRRLLSALGLGAALYGLYVVNIGGDFMTGRFWSLPVFVSAAVLYLALPKQLPARRVVLLAAVLLVAKAATLVTEPKGRMYGERYGKNWHSITDERLWYVAGHALFSPHREPKFVFRSPAPPPPELPYVIMYHAVGLKGFVAGPECILIDGLGLADPLTARLPAQPRSYFFPGHFIRGIPRGYMETRSSGNPSNLQADLAAYYRKLHLIVAGPVFSAERWSTLIAFNLGRYDHYRDAYLASGEAPAEVATGDLIPRLTSPRVQEWLRRRAAKGQGAP